MILQNNSLNKQLYPDLIEFGSFLVPRRIMNLVGSYYDLDMVKTALDMEKLDNKTFLEHIEKWASTVEHKIKNERS